MPVHMMVIRVSSAKGVDSKTEVMPKMHGIKAGVVGDSDLGGHKGSTKISELNVKADELEGNKKTWRDPVPRTSKEARFHPLEQASDFVIACCKLTNVLKEGENINVASKNIKIKAKTKLRPSKDRVIGFPNDRVPYRVSPSRSKHEAQVLGMVFEGKLRPGWGKKPKAGGEKGLFDRGVRKRDSTSFGYVQLQSTEVAKRLKKRQDAW